MDTYNITYTGSDGATHFYSNYPTVRKAKNAMKWMLERPVEMFRDVVIWKGEPGGVRVETFRPVQQEIER